VLKLHKALYGLRQAPRAWNSKLDAELHNPSFRKCKSEYGLYTRAREKQRLIVGVYVDDLIIMGESIQEVSLFKSEMKHVFRMSDLGALSYYLGIEVRQDPQDIWLCQSSYAMKLLERTGMKNCNPCAVPMEAKMKLSNDSDANPVDPTEYRSLIESLRYLLHTRPELTFSVSYLSRFMENLRQDHMGAIRHLLRYIAGTVDYGLFYLRGRGEGFGILGYSDSDMAGDVDDSKSTSEMIFFLGENPAT
jgi:hypothetical protein